MLTSREFGTSSTDLHKTLAQIIKRLCIEELESTTSLKAFTACRLIPLDKKPGLRPISVGEVLRRIAGKEIMIIFKKDITDAARLLQLSAGQEAGVHAMGDFLTEILIDAENAFSRKVMLHNLNFICPIITMYITNYYVAPLRLFRTGEGEILSKEGTTQGNSTAIGAYALGILPLIHFLLEFISISRRSVKAQ